MIDRDATNPQVEALIGRLGTGRRYAEYDLDEAERRMAVRQAARSRCSNPSCALAPPPTTAFSRPQWTRPALDGQYALEQAWWDLKAICTLVVGATDAAPVLEHFIQAHYADGPGARILACLLHLTGDRDGARWWWQFAAGAGDNTAGYCLLLDHVRRGELHDARFWGRQLTSSGFAPEQWGSRSDAPVVVEDLPDRVSPHITKKYHPALGRIPLPELSLVPALQELASADASTH
ncbi:hypothetical protein [Kitasatospora sp. NPDC047058]|uniref:hypothetical protein n=1 Tax=Kitasatospora sp. NPDC047058 TaxID=3155620 RepID=UPI0033C1842C